MNNLQKHLLENYEHNELADLANHGAQGGFGDFIYYNQTVKYFEQFKDEWKQWEPIAQSLKC